MGLGSSRPVHTNQTTTAHQYAVDLGYWPSDDALFAAVKQGKFNKAITLAKHANINLCTTNSAGQNPIHLAISLGWEEIAAQLVQIATERNSIAIHQPDREGYTPLVLAMECGNIPLARTLTAVDAAIDTGPNVNCSPDRLEERHRAIALAHLMKHANGDTAVAHRAAVNQGDIYFDKLLIGQDAPLRKACRQGTNAIRLQICKLGIDSSYVLARILLTQWDHQHRDAKHSVSKVCSDDVHTARKLIDVGAADPAEALSYVMQAYQSGIANEALCTLAAIELICLGASDRVAMEQAIASRNSKAVKLLGLDGHPLHQAVVAQAKAGNVNALRFLFSDDVADMLKDRIGQLALIQLTEHGHTAAVRLLIQEHIRTDFALTYFLSRKNTKAVNTLVGAGADGLTHLSDLLNEEDATGMAKMLIEAGVDPSKLLLELVSNHPKNLHQAKILIAAGANVSVALARASASQRTNAQNTLNAVSKEVSTIQETVARTLSRNTHEHAQAVGRILDAQWEMMQPTFHETLERLNKLTEPLASGSNNVSSEMRHILAALKRADWEDLIDSVANTSDAEDVLTLVMIADAPRLARLLFSAGVSETASIVDAILTYDIDVLGNLIKLGVKPQHILWWLAQHGAMDLATALIKQADIDLMELIRNVINENHADDATFSALKHLIPRIADGAEALARAFEQGDRKVAKALITAGVDINMALILAINHAYFEAMRQLLPIAYPSEALAKLLTTDRSIPEDQMLAAQVLLYLGADYDSACQRFDLKTTPPAATTSHTVINSLGAIAIKMAKTGFTKLATTT